MVALVPIITLTLSVLALALAAYTYWRKLMLIDLREFDGLSPDAKNAYRTIMIPIFDKLTGYMSEIYRKLRDTMTPKEFERLQVRLDHMINGNAQLAAELVRANA